MASRYRRAVTPAERERREHASADKLSALHERLAEQVAALRTGQDWRRWLDLAHRFHTYSFNNTLLIYAQRPESTAVAGYEAWKTLGRQVDKGERGIQILAPVVRRSTGDQAGATSAASGSEPDPARASAGTAAPGSDTPGDEGPSSEGDRRRVAGYRVAYVWDLSQTSGEPLPTQPRPQLLSGQAPAGLWDSLAELLADRGFTLERGDCGPANGWTDYTTRTVRVRGDVDAAQAVKTLAHEAGHVLLHDPSGLGESTSAHCQGVKEVEAESVAYLVTASHGLATDDYTFAYVTGWAGSVDGTEPEQVVRDTGQRVLTATRTVLAVTAPESVPTADASLAARVQTGALRTAAVRGHADAAHALALTPVQSGTVATAATADVSAADLAVLGRLHADATAFYAGQLAADSPDAARARQVLGQRAVPPGAVAAYEFGYAPAGWTAAVDHLRGRGYTDDQLLAAGVGTTTRRGSVVDRFRDRLMLPVRDPSGERVLAFLGRALTHSEGTPKYLNSPQTALYRKGDVLYGLGAEPTRQALAAGARPVLVEGALDAIAVTCAGGGRYAGVAPSGTALTAGQIGALELAAGPLAEHGVTVAFDADPAGRDAVRRSYGLLRAAGAWPAAAVLPDGQDPAGLAQHHGPDALRAVLDAAVPLADLVVDERLARWTGRLHWAEGQIGAARDAAGLIATFPSEHVGRQVLRVARQLGLEPAELTSVVVDTVSRDAEAPGRLSRRDRRDDLDRGQGADAARIAAPSAAQLARAGYPAPLATSARWAAAGAPAEQSGSAAPLVEPRRVGQSR